MPLTNNGAVAIAKSLMNDSPSFFNNAGAQLGVGNSTTAFDKAQTSLQGGSTAWKAMEASYPQRSSAAITFRSLFSTAEGNFAWEEWGVCNAASELLSRKVESLGTKTSAASWQLTVTTTITA